MTPTVSEVFEAARALLADPQGLEFTDSSLQPFYSLSYQEMLQALREVASQEPEREALITGVPAGATSVDLAAAGLTDIGNIHWIYQRMDGSNFWTPLQLVQEITPDYTELVAEYSGDTLNLTPADVVRDLRLKYSLSGTPPASGSIGIPHSMRFLANRIACLALSAREEGGAGASIFGQEAQVALESLRHSAVSQLQSASFQRPPFRARRR